MANIEEGEAKKVDLDNILVDEVGQFGKYQLVTLALAALPVIFSAFASGEYIFTTARIPSRCRISQCDVGVNPEYSPSWVLNAIPATSGGFDNCAQFANSTLQTSVEEEDTCPASLFNQNQVIGCDQYVYENTVNSVVYDPKDIHCWTKAYPKDFDDDRSR